MCSNKFLMLYKEALDHMSYDTPAQWESNAIAEIMDQKMSDYKKISTHRFPVYGTQKAWVLIKKPEFKDIPAGMESEVPFLQEELECCKPINP